MRKNVLFIAPTVGGFDKVIIRELKRQNYEVDFILEHFVNGDPLYVRNTNQYTEKEKADFYESLAPFWLETLSREQYRKKYDILFVIDGRGIHHCLFEVLKQRNPNLYSVNYLYDTMRSIYRFDKQFHNFDRVVTYDLKDKEDFEIEFLPICWSEPPRNNNLVYKVFGLGAYFQSRYELYKFVAAIAKKRKYKSYIKLFHGKIKYYPIKYLANLFLHKKTYVSPSIYYSDMIQREFMSNDTFNNILNSSEIILDSIDHRQDGLTARCTWALGAEKKIITDNPFIEKYPFYSKEQIYIVRDFSEKTASEIDVFMKKSFVMKDIHRKEILTFRIDNWIKYLLERR